jgi:hypothetical protein
MEWYSCAVGRAMFGTESKVEVWNSGLNGYVETGN